MADRGESVRDGQWILLPAGQVDDRRAEDRPVACEADPTAEADLLTIAEILDRRIDVPVEPNAPLKQGDVLFKIDPQPYQYVVDQKKAEEDAARMLSGEFTLEDFLQQVRMIQQMGPLKDLVEKIPGMGAMMPPGAELDGKEFGKIEAMIQSMTRAEKRDAQLLVREPSRAARVARGSGTPVEAVNELVNKFVFIKQMMGNMGGGAGGLLGKLPGIKRVTSSVVLRLYKVFGTRTTAISRGTDLGGKKKG